MADIRTGHNDSWMDEKKHVRDFMKDKTVNTELLRPAKLPQHAFAEGRGVAHGLGLDYSQISNLNNSNAKQRHMVGMSPGMPPQKKYRGST
jgi:hypothetical protein